ncbi:hypothetical protein X943_001268 [Babesia divergens]|uniref:Uncharacterized protein n=1 Tax=Babesia divergens TaxID=32595 RepID=A0AAD9G6U0_BABDI|nr:hypothetical protein X943_001268 [Babesia divergens]
MASSFALNTGSGASGGGTALFGTNATSSFGMNNVTSFGSTGTGTSNTGGMSVGNSTTPGFHSSFNNVGNGGPQGFNHNMLGNNKLPEKLNYRCTVRHLTNLIPHWKGHFDVADMLLSSQEKSMSKVRLMIDKLEDLDKNCSTSHENIKNSLNGISLLQDKLQSEVDERCKLQDKQNLISIKARRLSDSLRTVGKPPGTKISAVFRVPNHLNVQLSKELLDTIRAWKKDIHLLQMEVTSLKDIDLSQYVSTVHVVIKSHDKRITHISDRLTKAVSGADSKMRERRGIWDNIADETSNIKRAFLTAVGLPIRPPVHDHEMTLTSSANMDNDIKKQIQYLKKFNDAFRETGNAALDGSTFNIRELLQQPTPPSTNILFGGAGASTTNVFGGTGSNAMGSSLFGNNTVMNGNRLFGNSATGTSSGNIFGGGNKTTGAGLFGSTSTTNTTGGLFGSGSTTNTTGGLFGSNNTTNTTGGLFGSNNNTNTTGGPFGSNNNTNTTGGLFGSNNTTNTTGGLFGSNNNTNTTGGLFGSNNNTNTTGGLFGSNNTTNTTGGLFGSNNNTSTTGGLFGSNNNTNTTGGLFGSGNTSNTTGGLFGSGSTTATGGNNLFGSSNTTQNTNTGFGQQMASSSNVFGASTNQNTNTGLFGQQNTGSKSTAIVPYNPNPNVR